MSDFKKCIVCGMPLFKAEDYPEGANQETTDWCVHCGPKDGIFPYPAIVKGMTEFLKKTQGMADDQAKMATKEMVDNSEAVKSGRLVKE